MECRPFGLTGVLAVFEQKIDEDIGARVAALKEAILQAALPGVVEAVPAYASLLVRYDPFRTDYEALSAAVQRLAGSIASAAAAEGRVVEVPVCYGGAYGEDLPNVARHAGMSEEEVIRLHSSRTYRIYMLGFLPGFPYLGGMDERLNTPRLQTPRTRIPAGSVGIGGQQTGLYPVESPGGWQLIGRTPLTIYTPGRPLPYQAGDRIRFVPITSKQFDAIVLQQKEGQAWHL